VVQYILAFCRITTGLVFAWSFVGKAQDISSFIQTIDHFKLQPKALHHPVAVAFLGGELVVVVTMILGGKLLLWGFLLAGLLLILFSSALISVLLRKIQTPCNCFGTSSRAISYHDVVRNAGFVACVTGGCVGLSVSNTMPITLTLPEVGLTGFVAMAFVVIWTHLAEIVELFRPA
jgi:hypothetical protein